MRLTSLDNIVRDICIVTLQNPSLSQYMRVARAVRKAVMQTNLFYTAAVRSKLVTVSDNYTAALPPDCVVVTKVGVLCSDGTLMLLMNDSNLRAVMYSESQVVPEYCECDEAPAAATVAPVACQYDTFYNCQWGANQYGELYGASNGNYPSLCWRHNLDFGVLEFSTGWLESGWKVLVEYKTDGAGDYEDIKIEAAPAIEAYALYELFKLNSNVARGHMEEFRRLGRMLKQLHAQADPSALTDALLRGQRSSPR